MSKTQLGDQVIKTLTQQSLAEKVVLSLAILKVNWDVRRHDYIESFVSFIANLISKKKYLEIRTDVISKDFEEEYGLSIPYYPMTSILRRAKKRGVIKKLQGDIYLPDAEGCRKYDFSATSLKQMQIQEKVIKELIRFSSENYQEIMDEEEAEQAFITYLKSQDLKILFAAQGRSVLPEVKSSKGHRFLIHKFIQNAYRTEPDIFEFIKSVAIGHILASVLLFPNIQNYSAKLSRINLYFDTGIILSLMGIGGEPRKDVCEEFIQILLSNQAGLFVFEHTVEEIKGIFNTALTWLEHPNYDPKKATRATIFFKENNCRASDVERMLENIERALSKYRIAVVETPDYDNDVKFQIDEKKLESTIVDSYQESNYLFEPTLKSDTIQRDVKSLSAIYKLRKDKTPKRLKDARHIFITANWGLAMADRTFERSENQAEGADYVIPACLTDVFIGTVVWLHAPAKVTSLNEKKIIADCYAALQPDNDLLNRYLDEIERLKNDGTLSEDEYLLLRTSRVAKNMLEEKTLGEASRFTNKTPSEILEKIKTELSKDNLLEIQKEKDKHEATLDNLRRLSDRNIKMEKRITDMAKIISDIIANSVFILLLGVSIYGGWLSLPRTANNVNPWVSYSVMGICTIIAILSLIFGFCLTGLKVKIQRYISDLIINRLVGKDTH